MFHSLTISGGGKPSRYASAREAICTLGISSPASTTNNDSFQVIKR